ncbi:glycosyltransferase [Candidatus Omnitrophota bacterium]
MDPKVSIIIPTYNRAHYVCVSIDSALSQTFTALEIIVVDDGSTDNTREVVKKYGDKIQYIYQDNMGPPGAMNTGIRHAKGEYYLILGDDDELMPDIIQRHVEVLEKNRDLAFICSGIHFVDANGEIYKTSSDGRYREKTFKSLLFDNFVWHLSALVRRDISEEMGHFDESLLTTHDHDLWIRMAIKYRFEYTDAPLAKFRRHPGNFSKTLGLHLKDHLAILNKSVVRKQLSFLEWAKFRAVNYYRFGMFYARIEQYFNASCCYWLSVLNYSFVGGSFWTHETEKMKFSLPYRILKPYFMPFYYLVKVLLVKCLTLFSKDYGKKIKDAKNIRKDNLA